MRYARFGLLCLLLGVVPAWSKQPPPQQTQAATPSPAPKDTQAVSVVTQALTAAGGIPAITAIKDYAATGTITYHWSPEVQGIVTVRGLGLGEFRLDATLPTGLRSSAVTGGMTSVKSADENVLHVLTIAPLSPASIVFPYSLLAGGVTESWLSLTYKGVVQIDGRSAHVVRFQPFLGQQVDPQNLLGELQATDIFIDASTFQIIMTQDTIRNVKNTSGGHIHQLRFSDYQSASGVFIPFSINETVGGQPTWELHVNQISFNTGLQDSSFKLF